MAPVGRLPLIASLEIIFILKQKMFLFILKPRLHYLQFFFLRFIVSTLEDLSSIGWSHVASTFRLDTPGEWRSSSII